MKLRVTDPSLVSSTALCALHIKPFRVIRSLILAAALSALPMFTAPAAASNTEMLVPFWDFADVTIGTHRNAVPERLGDPPDRFSSDV